MELEAQLERHISISNNGCNYKSASYGVNKLALHVSPRTSNEATDKDIIIFTSPQSWLFGEHGQQLVTESVGTFRNVQTNADNQSVGLVKACREYRSMLQASVCVMNTDIVKVEEDSEIFHNLGKQCQLLYKIELLMGLAEITFIDSRPNSLILGQLLCWVRLHMTKWAEKSVEILDAEEPLLHPDYWQVIYGLVSQGRMSEAQQILQIHPDSNNEVDAFDEMDQLLRRMPIYQMHSGVSEGEFMARWRHWHMECVNYTRQNDFTQMPQLSKLAKILTGDHVELLNATSTPEGNSWICYLVGKLLFTEPNIKLHRLHRAALDAINTLRVPTTNLDDLLLSVMEKDALEVIRGCQVTLDNKWLSTHLCDLLFKAAGENASKSLGDLRSSLLQDYALDMVDHSSLWQISIAYLDFCGSKEEVSPLIPLLLERVPLNSDFVAHKVIHAALQRDLPETATSVCRVMGRKACSEGRLSAAISWGVRAEDEKFTAHTAHQVLLKYLQYGELKSSALLLDNLGPSMLISNTLTFLGKYREFHSFYQESDYKKAADLLVTIITSKLAPQYFWPILLLDALPLLQQSLECLSKDDLLFTSSHTYELMYCLNMVTDNISRQGKGKTSEKEDEKRMATFQEDEKWPEACDGMLSAFNQREHELRSSLTHNLAHAIVIEGTDSSMLLFA